jgi:AcrR family transcriptional regulator
MPGEGGERLVETIMKKGERTKRMIVERSAPVFNTKGFSGTSICDLVRETGFEKGGIYNHFSSKEELALAAFDYSAGIMRERFEKALRGKGGASERLFAVIGVLGGVALDPPVAGGCPVMNTAVEADDANTALKESAVRAMTEWHSLIARIAEKGAEDGELSARVDPSEVASLVVSTLEGALMLSKLYDDPVHAQRAAGHLEEWVRSLALRVGTEAPEA